MHEPAGSKTDSDVTNVVRIVAAAAIVVGGMVHLQLYFRSYRDFPNANLGRSFALNAIASVVIAALLLVRRDLLVRLAALGVSVGTIIAFVISRTADDGVFGFTEKGWNPSPQAALTIIAEVVAILAVASSFVPALAWREHVVISPPVGFAAAGVMVVAGIVGAVVWAGEDRPTTVAAAPTANGVTIIDFEFGPAALVVAVGTEVTWTNNGPAPHNVDSQDDSFDSQPTMAAGDTFAHTFAAAGTFDYVCSIHPFMTGTVEVTG